VSLSKSPLPIRDIIFSRDMIVDMLPVQCQDVQYTVGIESVSVATRATCRYCMPHATLHTLGVTEVGYDIHSPV
jgi:hypothetical protein